MWKSRHAVRRALASSDDLRQAAVIRGCDCWPVVRDALDGIALLQFPWSARAMDEAGAALDAVRPDVALTYAEAGGWGRALALEARRRNVPLAGLQHGFIYRHWLNYRHEPDEMAPPAAGSTDAGFPLPSLTLVFDDYAAEHLVRAGRFPRDAIAVSGSPRLDALAVETAALTGEAVEGARRQAGAAGAEPLVLIVSKHTEIRRHLPALLEEMPNAPRNPGGHQDASCRNARAVPNLRPAASRTCACCRRRRRSPPLLRGAHVVVTVNSTVAIDSLALGIPALTVGLPNNLSPFVEAGRWPARPRRTKSARRCGASCMIEDSVSSSKPRRQR